MWQIGATGTSKLIKSNPSLVKAVENWIDKYGSPEPTAVEVLGQFLEVLDGALTVKISELESLCDQARAVIKREKGRMDDGGE